jgi:endonuclease/exonuclease/phosphatase family metal-dependent hydrolase
VILVNRAGLGLAVWLISAFPAGAALLLSDAFNYSDGPLVTATTSPWTTYSGSSGQINVISGRIFLSKANSEDVQASLAGEPYVPASGAVLYVSFKINYTTLPSHSGSYFAEFKDGGLGFRARIFAQTAGAAAGAFRVGIANGGSSPSAVFDADLQTNTDYILVARLVVSNAVSTLWVNPAAETNAAATATDATSAQTITGYGFREDGASGTIGNLFVDDVRVGTTFCDVVTNAPPLERPAVVSSPKNQAVTNGANVTFSVSAGGLPPPVYQWQFTPASSVGTGATNLPGEVSSNLTLTDVTFARAGFYSVLITNVLGSVSSRPAALDVWRAAAPAVSLLTYNLHGNGLTNWSTNMWHVQAIGRQVQFLDPDVLTFQEIPVTNNCTAQMEDFVTAFRPGYYLVTNSTDDGFIRSVILSRDPIVASRSWLHGCDLSPFGYTNSGFTRDLFEAEISVPGFPQPLHVFTAHLKSGQNADESAKRAAEASAVSNFFATVYLPVHGQQPYVLSGDFNEDVLQPSFGNPQALIRLAGVPTGLQLVTPINLFTGSEQTWSIQDADGLTRRYDYILPCALLASNVVGSQVFRTDLLSPSPANLYSNDDKTASDHLPVLMFFGNPFNAPFRLLAVGITNNIVSLTWESQSNCSYNIEVSSNLIAWTSLATNVMVSGDQFTFTTNAPEVPQFFRIQRIP